LPRENRDVDREPVREPEGNQFAHRKLQVPWLPG
jgi:hypothetical protein